MSGISGQAGIKKAPLTGRLNAAYWLELLLRLNSHRRPNVAAITPMKDIWNQTGALAR